MGVIVVRALLFGVDLRVSDFWKLPYAGKESRQAPERECQACLVNEGQHSCHGKDGSMPPLPAGNAVWRFAQIAASFCGCPSGRSPSVRGLSIRAPDFRKLPYVRRAR